jgi:hypothetical protein
MRVIIGLSPSLRPSEPRSAWFTWAMWTRSLVHDVSGDAYLAMPWRCRELSLHITLTRFRTDSGPFGTGLVCQGAAGDVGGHGAVRERGLSRVSAGYGAPIGGSPSL